MRASPDPSSSSSASAAARTAPFHAPGGVGVSCFAVDGSDGSEGSSGGGEEWPARPAAKWVPTTSPTAAERGSGHARRAVAHSGRGPATTSWSWTLHASRRGHRRPARRHRRPHHRRDGREGDDLRLRGFLDAGYLFVHRRRLRGTPTGAGGSIASLDEILEAHPGALFNLEIKQQDLNIVAETIALVRARRRGAGGLLSTTPSPSSSSARPRSNESSAHRRASAAWAAAAYEDSYVPPTALFAARLRVAGWRVASVSTRPDGGSA